MQQNRTRIQYVIAGMNACAWYRCTVPGRALTHLGYEVRINESLSREMVDWADVVVFQRIHDATVHQAIRYCRDAGRLTVYEIDDDLWNIHPDSGAFPYYSTPGVLEATEEAIRACELVTTTTQPLADRLKSMNRNICVLPNMLPDESWQFEFPVSQSQDRVVIGWAGSNTHLPDLKLLLGVVHQLLSRFDNVEFAWAGTTEMPLGAHERMRMLDPVPLEEYPQLLGNFHIGLAPVVDSVFNRSKSDLKYLEYARRGIPVVASRTASYGMSIENGVNGYLAGNAKDWLKYLTRLVENVELRRDVGLTAMAYARTRMMSGNVGRWEEAYGLSGPRSS